MFFPSILKRFLHPLNMKKHAFSLRKQYFSQNHPLAKNTIFLSILSSFLVPFSFNFGIVFRYFFGIDFRVTFFATFFDFWCHYRRPRGPTGDLRVAIFAPKGLQKGTTPLFRRAPPNRSGHHFAFKTLRWQICRFLVVFWLILAPFLNTFGMCSHRFFFL